MKTAAAIDALTRLIVLAAMILVYQYFLAAYVEHKPENAWAPQIRRYLERRWRERRAARVPEAFNAIRLKKSVDLPTEE